MGCMLMCSPRSATACGGTGVSIRMAGGVIRIITTGPGVAGMVSAGVLVGVPGGDLIIGIIRPIGQVGATGVDIIIGEMLIRHVGLMEDCALRIMLAVGLLPLRAEHLQPCGIVGGATEFRHRAIHGVAAYLTAGW